MKSFSWYLEGIWLPVHANICYLHHLVRGHDVIYFDDLELWFGHLGFITCRSCPDCNGSSLCIWGHDWQWLRWATQSLCGFLGHKEAAQWQESTGEKGADGEPLYVPSGRWYCSRCVADVPAPEKEVPCASL